MPVNVIRLNQQEIAYPDSRISNSIQNQTNMASTARSIFSLGQNILSDRLNILQPKSDTTNGTQRKISDIQHTNKEQTCLEPVKITPILFSPRKFVPAEKTTGHHLEVRDEIDQTSTTEKIKPKWSPCSNSNDNEPRYKKIQPIFQKPKSPHKIT